MSLDGGKSWRTGTPPPGPSELNQLTAVPGGFLAVGNRGDPQLDSASWTSVDGLIWRPVDLGLSRTSGPGNQLWVTSVIHRGRLVLAGLDAPPTGGDYFAATAAIPKP